MIRLLCVEDDPLVGSYLATRLGLEPDIEVRGVIPDASEALAFLREQRVDIVLLDYRLEGADGMQLLSALSGEGAEPAGSTVRVLFCTAVADGAFDSQARALGAAGVVPKDQMAAQLIPAVRAVAGGESWFRSEA